MVRSKTESMIATSGERTAKPSNEAVTTQKPAPVEEAK